METELASEAHIDQGYERLYLVQSMLNKGQTYITYEQNTSQHIPVIQWTVSDFVVEIIDDL